MQEPVWYPTDVRIKESCLYRLMQSVGVSSYDGLRTYALQSHDEYWRSVVVDLGIEFRHPFSAVLDSSYGVAWLRGFRTGV